MYKMKLIFYIAIFSINTTAEEYDSGLDINDNELCTLIFELRDTNNRSSQQITSAGFNFSNIEWEQTEYGKKRGYLNSSYANDFKSSVEISLDTYEDPSGKPCLIAHCFFEVEIPELPLRFKHSTDSVKQGTPSIETGRPPRMMRRHGPKSKPPPPNVVNGTASSTRCDNHCKPTCKKLGPWSWVGIGAAVTGNLFCMGILICMTLHYRKKVKEFETKEILASIRVRRPPEALPPEVVYDAVYSHRINLYRARKSRCIPIEERTAAAVN